LSIVWGNYVGNNHFKGIFFQVPYKLLKIKGFLYCRKAEKNAAREIKSLAALCKALLK